MNSQCLGICTSLRSYSDVTHYFILPSWGFLNFSQKIIKKLKGSCLTWFQPTRTLRLRPYVHRWFSKRRFCSPLHFGLRSTRKQNVFGNGREILNGTEIFTVCMWTGKSYIFWKRWLHSMNMHMSITWILCVLWSPQLCNVIPLAFWCNTLYRTL